MHGYCACAYACFIQLHYTHYYILVLSAVYSLVISNCYIMFSKESDLT